MWNLDCEESWVPKNWCFWTVVLEETLESQLDCKEIQPVHSERDQSWDFFGRNDAKAETPVLWPPHVKSWLTGKDSDAGRNWGQEKKGTTEDEMAGWHHGLDGRESEWTPGGVMNREAWRAAIHGVAKSQTCLSDWTELNWTELNVKYIPQFKKNHAFKAFIAYHVSSLNIHKHWISKRSQSEEKEKSKNRKFQFRVRNMLEKKAWRFIT